MPLLKGKKNVGRNIKIEMAHGKPRLQAIAIAMSMMKKKKKKDLNEKIKKAKYI